MFRTLSISGAMAIAAMLFMTGCETQSNTTRVTASGATVIDIRNGLNCYDGRCFSYDARRGLVAATGRRATTPPVSLASGSVTPSQFSAIFDKCMQQGTRGSGGGERD